MRTYHITLNTINDVNDLLIAVIKIDSEVDLVSARYSIYNKSILGIFCLDLSKPIQMHVHADACEQFLEPIKHSLSD